ncbi:MAG: hypothetical protein HFI86_05760 [Bacilli bacterium]|nr:hypothetical protein [Bacilli bacterium]
MKNKIEDRFDPPFAYYKHAINGYVVRPLNWEGIWKDGFIFVGGNTMLHCDNEEDAKMIADTFNRFFELLKENKQLKLDNQKLDSCLTEYTTLYKEELEKNRKALEYIEVQDNFVDYKGYDNQPEQELYDVVEILRGVRNE